jgi:uncharacterized Zn finger protein
VPRAQISFSLEDILRWIDRVAYERGAVYAREARVAEIKDDGDDELRILSASVRGSETQPYTTLAASTGTAEAAMPQIRTLGDIESDEGAAGKIWCGRAD